MRKYIKNNRIKLLFILILSACFWLSILYIKYKFLPKYELFRIGELTGIQFNFWLFGSLFTCYLGWLAIMFSAINHAFRPLKQMEKTLYQISKYDMSGIDDIISEDEYNKSLNYLYLIKQNVTQILNKCNYNKGKIDNTHANMLIIENSIKDISEKLNSFLDEMLAIDTEELRKAIENSDIAVETKSQVLNSIELFKTEDVKKLYEDIKELHQMKAELEIRKYALFTEIADELNKINLTKDRTEDISKLING